MREKGYGCMGTFNYPFLYKSILAMHSFVQ